MIMLSSNLQCIIAWKKYGTHICVPYKETYTRSLQNDDQSSAKPALSYAEGLEDVEINTKKKCILRLNSELVLSARKE